MAKPATAKKEADNVVEFGSNEFTLERATELAGEEIEKIEAEQAKIDSVMEDAKTECAPNRDEIAKLRKKCRDDYGIEAKALGTILTKRRQDRRMADRISNLPDRAREQFDLFEKNLKG